MKRSIALLGALACAWCIHAQPGNTVPKNIRAANTLNNLVLGNRVTFDNLYNIPLEPRRIVGNAYLNPEWKRTTFLLYDADKMIEGYPARYEIGVDQFEIKAVETVKVLNGNRVKSFISLDSVTQLPQYFVNGRDLRNEADVPLDGFIEVLTDGAVSLFAKTDVVVIKPSYNDKFDMGNRNARIAKKRKFYYGREGRLTEIPASRKKFVPVFGTHAAAIDKFIKTNKLSLSDEAHLLAIFEHYNKLVTTN